MCCRASLITRTRRLLCALLAVTCLSVWATIPGYSFNERISVGASTAFASHVKNDAPFPGIVNAAAECPTLPAPSSMSGSTELNTVKAQMWIVNGVWWGAFASGGLYFYKRSGNSFSKGALIDSAGGRPDTLWNGANLFVLAYKSSSSATLHKYSYNSATQTYTELTGFPVNLSLSGASAITFAQDSKGKLWAAYTGSGLARVIWSTSADHTVWNTAGFTLASGIPSGEIAAIVAFAGGKIGAAWSNQSVGEDGFRYHLDGDAETSWSGKEIIDCCKFSPGGVADDHMNIKAAPDGRVFLVAKDSNLNASGTGNGNLHLYVRSQSGSWAPGVLVNPDPLAQPTRPSLLLDIERNEVYVVYVDSAIDKAVFSHTSMDSPSFGPACSFIDVKANNLTSTKQNLNSNTDLIAAGSISGQILSNVIDLQPAGTQGPTITSLLPDSAIAGGPAIVLTVNGAAFANDSKVQWNGSERTTVFVNSTQLMADISSSDIAAPGTVNVSVLNPTPSGLVSNTRTFTINSATPTPTPTPTSTPTPTPTATPTPSPPSPLSPLADARVRSSSGTSNYGTDTDIRTRLSSSSSNYESYLKFNLSGVSGGITKATLRLYGRLSGTSSSGIPVSIFAVSSTTWTETGITWNNKPTVGTLLATVVVPDTINRYYEWDLSAYVQSEKAAGRNVVSLALKSTAASSPYTIFNSREASSNRPQLVVTGGASPNQARLIKDITRLQDRALAIAPLLINKEDSSVSHYYHRNPGEKTNLSNGGADLVGLLGHTPEPLVKPAADVPGFSRLAKRWWPILVLPSAGSDISPYFASIGNHDASAVRGATPISSS